MLNTIPFHDSHRDIMQKYFESANNNLSITQMIFITFIFISIGLITNHNNVINCAGKQNIPDFMQDIIYTDLTRLKIDYSIVIHNTPDGAISLDDVWIFLDWKSRVETNLNAVINIYPSKNMFNKGIIENTVLTYFPGNVPVDYGNKLPSQLILNNWKVSPTLDLFNNGEHDKLSFFIQHLFDKAYNTLTVNTITHNSDIIDLRGYCFNKIGNMITINAYKEEYVDIYNLPVALERFIDVLNDNWLPLMTI